MYIDPTVKKIDTDTLHQYISDGNNGYEAYSTFVRSGDNSNHTTKFGGNKDVYDIIAEWLNHLEQTLDRDIFEDLILYERDMASKVGPMSYRLPLEARIPSINEYFTGILSSRTDIDDAAVSAVIKEFISLRGLHLISPSNAANDLPHDSNSGAPLFDSNRGRVLATTLKYSGLDIRGSDVFYRDDQNTVRRACAILGWRGQEGGPKLSDVKQRVIWMFMLYINILEAQVYQPFIRGAQHFGLMPAWIHNDEVDMRMTHLFDTKRPEDYVICTDFKSYDQHFNDVMQTVPRKVYSVMFKDDPRMGDWIDKVYPVKFMIPLLADDILFSGSHGMASGSNGTNCDESVAHRALQHEAAIVNGKSLNIYSQCNGDDGCISFDDITEDKVLNSYTSHGLVMQKSKQKTSRHNAEYLRRWYSDKYRINGIMRGVYCGSRALGKFKFMERSPKRFNEIELSIREIQIANNVRWHPEFEYFVKLLYKYSATKCGTTIPGFLDNIDNHESEYNRKFGKYNWRYRVQSVRSEPLSKSPTVRILRELYKGN